jgi:hypothetical protein
MQPTSDQPDRSQPPQYPPAASPYSDAAPAPAGWSGPAYAPPVPAATVKKARPWRVAIVAFLTLLVLIAGLGNQWVTDSVAKHVVGSSFIDNAARAMTSYQWRFSPQGGSDVGHVWLASLGLVAAALVLTLLLTAAVCRGNGGFGQAFIGAWLAVVGASMVAGYVRAVVIDAHKLIGPNAGTKANVVFFSGLSPGALLLAAALGFGLIVGLVAGLTAVLSRHTEVITAPIPPGYGAPAFAPPGFGAPSDQPYGAGVPGPIASPSPWGRSDEPPADQPRETGTDGAQHTAVLPPVDAPAGESTTESTTEMPRRSWPSDSSDGEHTTQLPRSSATGDDTDGPRHAT